MARLPYVGFRPYDQTENSYFCGRQGEIAVIHDAFTEQVADKGKILVVYGPSSVGKTSLVQAGLYPLLHLNQQASSLERMAPNAGDSLGEFTQAIRQKVGRLSGGNDGLPLVFIDQLEDVLGFPLDGDLDPTASEQLAKLLEFLVQAAQRKMACVVIGMREPWSRFLEEAPKNLSFPKGNMEFFRLNELSSSGLEEVLRTPLFRWKNGASTNADEVDQTFFMQFYGELNTHPATLPLANRLLLNILEEFSAEGGELDELAKKHSLLDFILDHAEASFAKWPTEDQAKLPIFVELFLAAGVDESSEGIRSADARPLIVDPDARDVLFHLLDAKLVTMKGNHWNQAEIALCDDRLLSAWDRTSPKKQTEAATA